MEDKSAGLELGKYVKFTAAPASCVMCDFCRNNYRTGKRNILPERDPLTQFCRNSRIISLTLVGLDQNVLWFGGEIQTTS